MKSKLFSLLIINVAIILLISLSTINPVSATQQGKWWDDFVPCEWNGEGYWQHECHPVGPYPICVGQDCVGYASNPID